MIWLTWGSWEALQGPDAGYDLHLAVVNGDDTRSEQWNSILERIRDQRIFSVIPDGEDGLWIAVEDGVLRFDLAQSAAPGPLPEPLLTRFTADNVALPLAPAAEVGAGQEIVMFHVGLPSFVDESKTLFQYKLEGLTEKWSPWTTDSAPAYANLAPGDYRLRVRARNVYGGESPELNFGFAVLPPWYQTSTAYLFYGLALLSLLWVGDKLRHRHLEARERELGHLVNERSAALEKSESRYRSLVDNARDAILTTDRHGRIMTINPAGAEMTGRPAEALIGTRLADLIARESSAEAAQLLNPEAASADAPVELKLRGQNGDSRTVEVTRRRLYDREQVSGIETVARDVTLRKEIQDRLGHSQRLEAMGQLAGGVAHDINNNLTVILGYADLLRDHPADDELKVECVDLIKHSGEQSRDLAQKLLAFGRKQVLKPRAVDLAEVLQGMQRLWKRVLPESIELNVRALKGVAMVLVDPGQLEQVTMNLVTNAMEAMPSGGRLDIELDVQEIDEASAAPLQLASGRWAVTRFRDTGSGMSPEVCQRVFEPFFSTKDAGRGSGLGLASVHGIVQQMGGSVAVESTEGVGSVFTVYLPVTVDAEIGAAEAAQPDLSEVRGDGRRVLLVEDDPHVRAALVAMLRDGGYDVAEAANAEAATALMTENTEGQHDIDVLISDVRMPGLSGVELAHGIREIRPRLPILLISGYAEEAADLASLDVSDAGGRVSSQALRSQGVSWGRFQLPGRAGPGGCRMK